jgi:hypothetical protein
MESIDSNKVLRTLYSIGHFIMQINDSARIINLKGTVKSKIFLFLLNRYHPMYCS